jgi:hypothetical protein
MKNIHILPTDKPSRLLLSKRGNLQFLKDKSSTNPNNHFIGTYQNIYITSDEKPNGEDWFIRDGYLHRRSNYTKYKEVDKKIILTTDQDLIKDGVQAIDDEFLEWFVKNPSCERVEVNYDVFEKTGNISVWEYDIIIPQEESKQ